VNRTWDEDWNERRAGKSCPMCAEGRPDEAHGNARIFAGRLSDAYLVRGNVGQPGYTIVIWRGRHVADPTELPDAEAAGYFREVMTVCRALEAHYRPAKLNLEMLGNTVPHLHTHIVPRYVTDDSPSEPARFMRVPDLHRDPIPDGEFHRDVAALRVALARATQKTA
jgi:diadenosine tetraphosphate (Ap4A) HIT family hydrolase